MLAERCPSAARVLALRKARSRLNLLYGSQNLEFPVCYSTRLAQQGAAVLSALRGHRPPEET